MSEDRGHKKKLIRELIDELHGGLSAEEARDRFEREIGTISSSEIAEIEQSLIDDGMAPEEIQKFCNVHALLFESALKGTKDPLQEVSSAHPIHLFQLENRELEKLTGALRELLAESTAKDLESTKARITEILDEMSAIERHYARKEQILFPYLEKYGFMGPTKVMWGKDDEVRGLLKEAHAGIADVDSIEQLKTLEADALTSLLDEAEGMVQKEEDILFPTSLEKLQTEDWADVLRQSDEVGYAFIDPPAEISSLMESLKHAVTEEAFLRDGAVSFPSGSLLPDELMGILNALPVELTFVGPDDKVRYFSEGRDRIFVRTRAIIGREVKNCHPPGSVHLVEKIVDDFKSGQRDDAEFWLEIGGRFIHIEFVALRDAHGEYMGTLEIAGDVTHLRNLQGERRLLDDSPGG